MLKLKFKNILFFHDSCLSRILNFASTGFISAGAWDDPDTSSCRGGMVGSPSWQSVAYKQRREGMERATLDDFICKK